MNFRRKQKTLKWYRVFLLTIAIAAAFFAARRVDLLTGQSTARAAVGNEAPALTIERTSEFISYDKSLSLSADQRKVFLDALSPIPAPCCSKNSMATCCCPCNLAKSVWGLSKYLIVEKNYSSSQVRQSAQEWLRVTNPKGYSGDACLTGGCNRSFAENGCGGMNAGNLIGVP